MISGLTSAAGEVLLVGRVINWSSSGAAVRLSSPALTPASEEALLLRLFVFCRSSGSGDEEVSYRAGVRRGLAACCALSPYFQLRLRRNVPWTCPHNTMYWCRGVDEGHVSLASTSLQQGQPCEEKRYFRTLIAESLAHATVEILTVHL